MDIPDFKIENLLDLLFTQKWQKECVIIPDYMPQYTTKKTKPTVVVKYPNKYEDVFLRYSVGPQQCYFWDTYGDNFVTVELAIMALHQAPVPLNYSKLETRVKFSLGKKEEGLTEDQLLEENRRLKNMCKKYLSWLNVKDSDI